MDALQDKGFIKHTKEKDERWVGDEHARFTVLILNNDYSEIMAMGEKKDFSLKPYVSLNPEILHTRKFREATKNVKILILKFLELLNTKPYKKKEKLSFDYKDLLAWTMIYCKDFKSRKEVSLRAL